MKAALPVPMPPEERDRLERLIGYLEKNASEPPAKLQKTADLARSLLEKYGDGVPESLRKRADKVFDRFGS